MRQQEAGQSQVPHTRSIDQFLAWAQFLFSFLLAITSLALYVGYRATLAGIPGGIAATIIAASEVLEQAAVTTAARQDVIGQTRQALSSARNLVDAIGESARTQRTLLPKYVRDLKNASKLVEDVGSTLADTGIRLDIKVPSGLKFEDRWKAPSVEWTQPLHAPAEKLTKHGENVRALGATIAELSLAVDSNGTKVNERVIEQCEKTVILLEGLEQTTRILQSENVPAAVDRLRDTSGRLRNAAEQARAVRWALDFFLLLWTLAAVAMVCNSVITLRAIRYRQPGS